MAPYGGLIVYICMGVYMGPLLGPLVYLYIWAHYGGPIVYMGVVFYK